ncbi:MAG TPA: hypothetical protein V6C72_16925, partial [Chroococcales cyanobacterium]
LDIRADNAIGIVLFISGVLSAILSKSLEFRGRREEKRLMNLLIKSTGSETTFSILGQLINVCIQNGNRRKADSLSRNMLYTAETGSTESLLAQIHDKSIADGAPLFSTSLMIYARVACLLGGAILLMLR